MQNDNERPDNHVQSSGQLTALGVLSILDTTKAQRKSFAEQVIGYIEAGEVNPLMIHCQIKATENLIKQFTDKKEGGELNERYMAAVLAEAQKNGKNFEYHSGKFTIKEAGQKYDYSMCGDEDLLKQMDVHEAMGQAIKDRQEFLRKLPSKGITEVVESSGEVRTLYPPSCTSTTTVAVTLK